MPTHPILDFDGEPDFSASKVAMQRNSFKCRNAAEQSRYVFHNSLETLRPKLGDHDFAWRSHATNFARGGIYHAGKNYMRDPRSGVWFNSQKVQTPGMSGRSQNPATTWKTASTAQASGARALALASPSGRRWEAPSSALAASRASGRRPPRACTTGTLCAQTCSVAVASRSAAPEQRQPGVRLVGLCCRCGEDQA
eukprot:CAMPEP_0175214722 /NCGR_PEP_ID=MMETSP0093-20121207/16851_1 /TAXON_ID=311494 /ORGANISM="Alexandrium monilatum, Strain CCMP3105" /LENGTH=195 /DNA_ID=CAMNT_0016508079 /DNA_START=87 /DNA_END=671 /DNA_ORIENTATION=-